MKNILTILSLFCCCALAKANMQLLGEYLKEPFSLLKKDTFVHYSLEPEDLDGNNFGDSKGDDVLELPYYGDTRVLVRSSKDLKKKLIQLMKGIDGQEEMMYFLYHEDYDLEHNLIGVNYNTNKDVYEYPSGSKRLKTLNRIRKIYGGEEIANVDMLLLSAWSKLHERYEYGYCICNAQNTCLMLMKKKDYVKYLAIISNDEALPAKPIMLTRFFGDKIESFQFTGNNLKGKRRYSFLIKNEECIKEQD